MNEFIETNESKVSKKFLYKKNIFFKFFLKTNNILTIPPTPKTRLKVISFEILNLLNIYMLFKILVIK